MQRDQAASTSEGAPPPPVRRLVLVYNDRIAETLPLAKQLAKIARAAGREVCLVSAWDQEMRQSVIGADLAVTLGGDGTILRTARVAAPRRLALLGVNLGRLGFLTELDPDDALVRLPDYLDGHCWIEERHMLVAGLSGLNAEAGRTDGVALAPEYHALNDVVVGRGERSRVVQLDIAVDGAHLTTMRSDGVVVATATGSTAYSMSAGGPIVHPSVSAMVITPVLPHLSHLRPMVIPAYASICVRVHTDHGAMCSIDGQVDIRLNDGAWVNVASAPFPCRFLRARPGNYFYNTLFERLRGC